MKKETKKDYIKRHGDDLLKSETESKETGVIINQPIVDKQEIDKLKPWDRKQVELIKRTIAVGATDDELAMFRWVCHKTGLDPFMKQIYYIKRWDSKTGTEKGAIQVGIDGLRSIAEQTSVYAGNDDYVFEGELQKVAKSVDYQTKKEKETLYLAPEKAKATVYKIVQGVRCPFTATVRWDEYYPGDKQGFMWRQRPHVMLGKCAEAVALRKAFPAVLSGIYVEGELDRGEIKNADYKENETDFDKAIRMISQVRDSKGLESMKGKFEKSEKYTDKEKKEIIKKVDERLKELEKNASKKSPELQPANPVGEVAEGL